MINILTSGTLADAPASRTSRNGNAFVTAQLKTFDGDDSTYVSLIAFDETICKSLLALSKGDALVVSGSGKASSWTKRDGSQCIGLKVVVRVIMSQYAVTKKRKAAIDMGDYGLPAQSPLIDPDDDRGVAVDFSTVRHDYV